MRKRPIVAIDGPAGAGKSTIAKFVAKELGFLYVDTGAMYRAIAWNIHRHKIGLKDKKRIVQLAKKTNIKLVQSDDKLKVFVNGCNVTERIRTENITRSTNIISPIQGVRKILRVKQREIGKKGGIVMEGRDIGSVVFPNAEKKFYLDAKPKERAKRRWKELKAKGRRISLKIIAEAIRRRDYRDRHRGINPLIKAKDAFVIDSTALTPQLVAQKILNEIYK